MDTDLERIKTEAARLSPLAHVATIGTDGEPDVVPVHPAWEGDTIWFLATTDSVKARNVAHHAGVAMHWQVTAAGDGVEVWGTAQVHDDVETKRRLWSGVFDYDLADFAPGGPDDSPGMAFIAVRPQRAVYLEMYGMKGRWTWSA